MDKQKNEVCRFIKMFSKDGEAPLVYRPYNLINGPKGHDENSSFKHIGDLLLENGSNLIKEISEIDKNQKLVFAELPFNVAPKSPFVLNEEIKVYQDINLLASILNKISEEGYLFALIPEGKFSINHHLKVLSQFTERGYHYNIVIQVGKLYEEITALNLHLVCFQKKASSKILVGKLDKNSGVIYDNFLNNNNIDLFDGLFVDKQSFRGYTQLLISDEIDKKLSDHKDYSMLKLGEISEILESNIEENLKEKNLILIPRTYGPRIRRFHFDDKKERIDKRYYVIKITSNDVLSEYVKYFLNTSLGKLIFEEKCGLLSTSRILSKQALKEMAIIYPSINTQNEIIISYEDLAKTHNIIQDLRENLNESPEKARQVSNEIREINQKLGTISLEGKINEMINLGENKKIEFKETFGFNFHTNNLRDENLVKASIKNIAAFLNTAGGNLLIGIHDSGKISGLNNEIELHKSKDKFKLFFSDKVQKSIGSDMFYNYVDFQIIKISNKLILNVECKPSDRPCFYDKKDFYVRANPKAEKLEGTNLIDYTRTRFD